MGTIVQVTSTDTIAALTETWATITRTAGGPELLERIREQSGVSLHRSALVTLWRLANDGPQLISELAVGVGVDVSTMSRLLRQLGRDGLVERERQSDDLRRVEIRITDAGIEAHRRVSDALTAILAEAIEDWTQSDRDALVLLLSRFAESFIAQIERPLPALAR